MNQEVGIKVGQVVRKLMDLDEWMPRSFLVRLLFEQEAAQGSTGTVLETIVLTVHAHACSASGHRKDNSGVTLQNPLNIVAYDDMVGHLSSQKGLNKDAHCDVVSAPSGVVDPVAECVQLLVV